MNILEIIEKKRDKKELSKEEIEFAINEYINKNVKDYQMSALLMAIYLNGMTNEEISNLTLAMTNSGEIYDLSSIDGIKIDKHSTGGLGDKVTMILNPLIASLDIPMVKMSGKGLGFTGGTVDKLSSIGGFKFEYTLDEVVDMVNKYKICQMAQSDDMCKADKEIYSLRSVTGTLNRVSLIASSIMSKKLATGADKILLDVTCGDGAFSRTISSARRLAQTMVDIGKANNKETIAIITNMDQPLGRTIGNSLEVIETIESLKGRIEPDVLEVVTTLGAYIIKMAKKGNSIEANKKLIEKQIYNGQGYEKFIEWIQIQGGNVKQIKDISLLPKAKHILSVKANKSGYVHKIHARKLGFILNEIGGGRLKKDDKIDYSVGFVLNYKVNDFIDKDGALCYIHINDLKKSEEIINKVKECFEISDKKAKDKEMILDIIK